MSEVIVKNVFRDTDIKYFSGKTLGKNDIIKRDGHKMKVSTYLKKYGKKGLKEDLLHEFDLEEDILKEYNIHLETPEEKAIRMEKLKKEETVQENTSVSSPVEQDFVTTTTDIVEDVHRTPDVPPMDSSFYNPTKTGWNYHPYGNVLVGTVRKLHFINK